MTTMIDGKIKRFTERIGVQRACRAFGVNTRTYRHRKQALEGRLPVRERVVRERAPHPAALTITEKEQVLDALCSERFCDLAPAQVYNKLLDEDIYLCSERQMYRLLDEHGLNGDRRRGGHQRRGQHSIPRLQATRPNQCWSWDITKVRGPARGVLYHVYMVIDIFSRYVVGWTVSERESEVVARNLIEATCRKEGVNPDELTLHADRGGPMISGSLAELLISLGVSKTHSRPRVSNDNPYVEAGFKTMKYRPDYPDRFGSIQDARAWCREFFNWYNTIHYHSSIGYLHPIDLHLGRHEEILVKRQETLDKARARNPERFSRRPRPLQPPGEAWINKPTISS